MNKILKSAAVVVFTLAAFTSKAQNATESTFKINKAEQPAYTIELNYSPDVVEAALKKQLKETVDSKGDASKNIRAYKGIIFPQISPEKIDVYTSVERKSKKEKDKSIVYMLVSKGYENFVSGTSDPVIAQNAKNFLNSFMSTASAYNQEVLIKQQEEVVKKAQKKADNLRDDIKDYEKKIAEYQRKLEEARKDLANQETVVTTETKKLEEMKVIKQ